MGSCRAGRPSLFFVVLSLVIVDTGRAQGPLEVVPDIDLARYAGLWYEQARLPNDFQDQCIGDVTATYALRDDGRVDVVNRCRTKDRDMDEARGVARLAGERTGAKLKVRFAPAFLSFLPRVWGDYWIIGLADDYGWAVVGEPERKYLWILSRTPELNRMDYQRAVSIARDKGFEVDRLVRTPHQTSGGPSASVRDPVRQPTSTPTGQVTPVPPRPQ